jgi:hypothetical protein
MNDAELDDLIATTATVGDAEVGRWDLAGSEADLCEEIMSMQTIDTPTGDGRGPADPDDRGPGHDRHPSRHQRRRRLALVGAAAAAAALAAVTLAPGGTDPIAVSTIDAALATSSQALEQSGRADLRYSLELDGGEVEDGVEHWAFSGDETLALVPGDDGGEIGIRSSSGRLTINLVDRELLALLDGTATPPGDGRPGVYGVDPRTLLEELRASGTFEEVGSEDVDGVPTRRLRSTAPEDAPAFPVMHRDAPGEVTSLEVWVDDESVVRRLEMTTERDGYVESLSLQFRDLGEPIDLDALMGVDAGGG